MKKALKTISTFISLLLLTIIMVACDGETTVSLAVEGINGYSDAVIDNENNTISFNVDASTTTFDVSDIILPDNILINVYSDEEHTDKLSSTLNLEVGLNTFYLNIYFAEDDILNRDYTLNITRFELNVATISVDSLNDTYNIGDPFTEGTLLINYLGGTSEKIPLTLDMITGFDTTTPGDKTLIITYKDQSITFNYKVLNEVINIEVAELKNNYFLNETFVSGKLTLIYFDETTETIDLTLDMVSGFDTTTVGKKNLTITYNNLNVTYEIEVIDPAAVKAIEIVELKNNFFVDDSFVIGKLKVTYNDESEKTIDLTADLVTNFDTSTAGDKTLVVSYGGLTINYNYTVNPIVLSSISIKELQKEFNLNDSFVNGILTLTFNNGKSEDIELTSSMVSNFDTTKPGDKTLIITYEGFSIEYTIKVLDVFYDEDFEMPATSTSLNDEYVMDTVVTIISTTTIKNNVESYAENKELIKTDLLDNEYTPENIQMIKDMLLLAGITDDVLLDFNKSLNDGAALIYEFVYNFNNSTDKLNTITNFFNEDNLNKLKDLLVTLSSKITQEQFTVILANMLYQMFYSGSMSFDSGFSYYYVDSINNKVISTDYNEYITYLKGFADLSVLNTFLDTLANQNIQEKAITYSDYHQITLFLYKIVNNLKDISNTDIQNVIITSYKISTSKITEAEAVTYLNSILNIIDVIADKTDNFFNLRKVLKNVLDTVSITNGRDYLMVTNILNIIDNVLENIDLVIAVARTFDESIIKVIIDLFDKTPNILDKNIISLANALTPLVDEITTNTSLKQSIDSLFSNITNSSFTNDVIAIINNAKKLDINTVTDEELQNIYNSIDNLKQVNSIYLVNNNSVSTAFMKSGLTISEYYKLLNEWYTFYYIDNTNQTSTVIPINESNVILDTDTTPGVHKGTIKQNNLSYDFLYILYEPSDIHVFYSSFASFSQHLFKIEKGSDTFDEMCISTKENLFDNDYFGVHISEALDDIRCYMYYQNSHNTIFLSADYFDITYHVDTTTTGFKIGYIEFSGITTFYAPIEYYVYDNENPVLNYYHFKADGNTDNYSYHFNTDNKEICLPQNIILNYAHLEYYYNYSFERSYTEFDVSGFDTSTVGKKTITVDINGYPATISYTVIPESEVNKVNDLKWWDTPVYVTSLNIGSQDIIPDSKRILFYNKLNQENILTYQEFKNYILENYGQDTIVSSIYDKDENIIKVTIKYGSTIDVFNLDPIIISDDKMYDYTNIDLDVDDYNYVIDSYDEITDDYIFSLINKVTLYQEYIYKYTTISSDIKNTLANLGINYKINVSNQEYSKTYGIYFEYQNEVLNAIQFNFTLTEYENKIINISIYENNTLFYLYNYFDTNEFINMLAYLAQIEIYYPNKTDRLEGDEIIDFLTNNNFNIDSYDIESGNLTYTLAGITNKLYVPYVVLDETSNIIVKQDITKNLLKVDDNTYYIDSLIDNIHTIIIEEYDLYISDYPYINYLINNYVSIDTTTINLGYDCNVTFKLFNTPFNVIYNIFDLNSPEVKAEFMCYPIPDSEEINENTIKSYIAVILNINSFFLEAKDSILELVLAKVEIQIDNENSSFDIYYNGELTQTNPLEIVPSDEYNNINDISIGTNANGIEYDLNGEPFVNETYLLYYDTYVDIENLIINNIYEINIDYTYKPRITYNVYEDVVNFRKFVEDNITITKVNDNLYHMVIDYKDSYTTYSKPIDFVVYPYDSNVYSNMYFATNEYIEITLEDSNLSLEEYLATYVITEININDRIIFDKVEIVDFLNNANIKKESEGFDSTYYRVFSSYANFPVVVRNNPQFEGYINNLKFEITNENLTFNSADEITIETILANMNIYYQSSFTDDYIILTDEEKQIVSQYLKLNVSEDDYGFMVYLEDLNDYILFEGYFNKIIE